MGELRLAPFLAALQLRTRIREGTIANPLFRDHLLGGIEWTAGVASGGGDCVTFYEVVNQVAAKNITKHLERWPRRQPTPIVPGDE
jgi:hypothetical protein